MKLIIFGAHGMLGNYLVSYLQEYYTVIKLTRQDYDVMVDNNNNNLETLLLKHGINNETVIINAIGAIPQDCNINERMYIKINTLFPFRLAEITNKYGAHLIHSTTDCVFDGLRGDYLETDTHNATSLYGITKSLGEPEHCTIIRTSIIGEEQYHKRSLLEWLRSRKPTDNINGYINHYWNGITCLQYAKVVHAIISQNLFWNGVRHIISPHSVSKYELLKIINEVYDLQLTINPHHDHISCNRILKSVYDPIITIPNLQTQIMELYNYKIKINTI